MDISAAIAAAIEAVPHSERSLEIDRAAQRRVESSAVRLASLARSMLVGRQLPRECVALVFTAVAEDLLAAASEGTGAAHPPARRKTFSRKDVERREA